MFLLHNIIHLTITKRNVYILVHPNVKLFISHGGISGVYEAVDSGVPILGFLLLYDQPRDIERLVDEEMAISLDLLNLSKDVF